MASKVPRSIPIDPLSFRAVLGHFCSGITVVTSMTESGPVGFTCQSFSSLSLDPPLVFISPSATSTTWPIIREVGRFCINILSSDHEDVSAIFAVSGGDKFSGLDWSRSTGDLPVLGNVVAWIDCSVQAEHYGGDHSIVVGAVEDLAASADVQPLLYFQGRYASLQQ
jgi:flavin reductase (DIM6/NTAB) family NADH-FMN oxidoreductase RutF